MAAPAPAPAAPAGEGLSPAQVEAELAAVPEPQRGIAAMLPLSDLPPGWTVGKSGEQHLETFNADNLYEKIDGRAESFIQYGVKGMAYAFYHPTGDPSNELQLYIFEMADSLKALGKYGSEKPDEFQPVADRRPRDTPRPAARCSTRAGTTPRSSRPQDDPKFAAFALELAKRVAARQKPGGRRRRRRRPRPPGRRRNGGRRAGEPRRPRPAAETAKPASRRGHPGDALRPAAGQGPARAMPSTSPRMSSAIASSPTSSWPITRTGDVTWQGFLRPYRDAQEAKAVFEKYIEGVKKDGAEVKTIAAEGADEMVVSNNIGLVDVVFRKGNTVAGANGATAAAPAESLCPRTGQEPAGQRADASRRQVTHARPRSDGRSGRRRSINAATDDGFRGETLIPTEADDGRKTDPDAA